MQNPTCDLQVGPESVRTPVRSGLGRWRRLVMGLLAAGLWAAGPAHRALAQANPFPPAKLTYQGFLTDQNGVPVGNTAPVNRSISFRIFDALTGGNRLWASQQTVTVDKGHFSVLLGEGSAVGSEPFNTDLSGYFSGPTASDRFLELTVDNAAIAPRLQFLPAPYAMLARRANEVDAAGIVSGTIPPARLSGVDGSGLTSINASSIASGTLNDARLSDNVPKLSLAQTFSQGIRIAGNKTIHFGYDVVGREVSAGQIGYGTHSSGGSLDIVGAGTSGSTRKIQMWAEGGLQVNGPVTASGGFTGNGTIPLGGIIMWSGAVSQIPSGWALCNGQTVSGRTTPDLRDRFVVGAGNAYNPGNTGGNASIRLTVGQLPPHTHSVDDAYYAENHPNWGYAGSNHGVDFDNAPYTRNINTGSTGSGEAIDVRPPYYALAFIMRVQ